MPRRKMPLNMKHEQAAIVKTIGFRLKQARELCNLSQLEAAKKLGYSNSSKLAKMERAVDCSSIPLWLIDRAARLYEVSIDFLFGKADDWYTSPRMDQERQVSSWLFEQMSAYRKRDMQAVKILNDRIEAVQNAIESQFEDCTAAAEAFDQFVELNPKFVDMRGGARLERRVKEAAQAAERAKGRLNRFRADVKIAAAEAPQLDFFKEAED